MLAGCNSTTSSTSALQIADINEDTKFSVSRYGAASPRLTRSRRVRAGGGRRMVGKPYTIAGRRYVPKHDPNYEKTGLASWYGPNFHGRSTANGEIYDQYALTAAHPTMPLPSYARVTNMENGKSVMVRVNDRGPFTGGRLIDLSGAAAKLLGYRRKGLARVHVTYEGPAPLHGKNLASLAKTFEERGARIRARAQSAVRDLPKDALPERFIIPAYAATKTSGS